MRYPTSGANSAAIEPASGAVRNVLGKDISTTRIFWLRSIWYAPSGTDGALVLCDATAGSTGGSGTIVARLPAATSNITGLPAGYREFAPPGLKFTAGCAAYLAASGAIAIGSVGGSGYEE